MGRAYALPIENYSSSELKRLFDKHISPSARIVTDGWTGYKPLSETYRIRQEYSENGRNFPAIHTLIMNIKCWIRGIHHSIQQNRTQLYLNEFFFRFNRRVFIDRLPALSINRIVNTKHTPVPLSDRGNYG